ncbi:hypothetical protein ST47_g1607 [Ascochyta rabiei]|uniref:Cytochrome c oxidase assembly factor 3 n=2 Tax=Didymella rabiei TaxID=5454 RepID=A0A163KTN8_DIDRA|nr:hypothetical protein ST47_g1607 [Ascochyta rabiei]
MTLVHAHNAVKLLRDRAQSLLNPVPSFPAKLEVKKQKERGERSGRGNNERRSCQVFGLSPPRRTIIFARKTDEAQHATMGYKPFQSTYYDARMRASPALLRARAPYLLKNTITGFAICSLVIGIYTYTINAISQDEFEDVIVPDEPIVRSQQPAGTTAAVQQALDARK